MEDIATSFKYNRALKNRIVEYLKSISSEEKLDYDEIAKNTILQKKYMIRCTNGARIG